MAPHDQPGTRFSRERLCSIMDQYKETDGYQAVEEMGGAAVVASNVDSSPSTGLASDPVELQARREAYGSNLVIPRTPATFLQLVWAALHDATILMLIVSATVSLILGAVEGGNNYYEGAAILLSVFIVTLVSASTDYAKEHEFHALRALVADEKVLLLRDGRETEVSITQLVVGDIAILRSGAVVPADGLVIVANELRVDESSLTGETKLVHKGVRDPFLLSHTQVGNGEGRMLVTAVGPHSVGGRIQAAIYGEDASEEETSVLFVKLNHLAIRIGIWGMWVAALCTIVMTVRWTIDTFYVRGEGWGGKDDFSLLLGFVVTGVTILVVAVPEGLPLAVTLSLAFSVRRMQKVQNLVKHLDSVETMGSATTICSDKTGTLTLNKMTVQHVYLGGVSYTGSPVGAELEREVSPEFQEVLAHAIAVNSTARLEGTTHKGNPTECALLQLSRDMGIDYEDVRALPHYQGQDMLGVKQFPFSSARKMMSWVVRLPDGTLRLFNKGASEIVLERCTSFLDGDGVTAHPLDARMADTITDEIINGLSNDGMRTLMLAYRDFPREPEDWDEEDPDAPAGAPAPTMVAETGLTLLCVVGIEDPLRVEVPGAIKQCKSSGVDVRMVTGDNLGTAISIARKCGILQPEHFDLESGSLRHECFAMEGKAFRERVFDETGTFVQAEFDRIWPFLRVLARSSPEDKLTLVNGLNQSLLFEKRDECERLEREWNISIYPDRQVVAVTGDGTNDAQALKRADVGFAMGIQGTSIARDACDIILLDDNFNSIVVAMMWGRNVYDSISKFLQFQLTVNVSAICIAVIGAFAYEESPLSAVQMLWVNLIMDSLASLALATEPPTPELLTRAPYGRNRSLISFTMYSNIFGHAIYQLAVLLPILFYGHHFFSIPDGRGLEVNADPTVHYTILFNTFVLMQLFNEFNSRKLYGERNVFRGVSANPIFMTIVLSTLVLQAIIVQFGGLPFSCADGGLTLSQWMWCMLFGALTLVWQQVLNVVVCPTMLKKDEAAAMPAALKSGVLRFGRGREAGPSSRVIRRWHRAQNAAIAAVKFSKSGRHHATYTPLAGVN